MRRSVVRPKPEEGRHAPSPIAIITQALGCGPCWGRWSATRGSTRAWAASGSAQAVLSLFPLRFTPPTHAPAGETSHGPVTNRDRGMRAPSLLVVQLAESPAFRACARTGGQPWDRGGNPP